MHSQPIEKFSIPKQCSSFLELNASFKPLYVPFNTMSAASTNKYYKSTSQVHGKRDVSINCSEGPLKKRRITASDNPTKESINYQVKKANTSNPSVNLNNTIPLPLGVFQVHSSLLSSASHPSVFNYLFTNHQKARIVSMQASKFKDPFQSKIFDISIFSMC